MFKRAFVAGIAMLALSASADDMLFRQGSTSIRLMQSPCELLQAAEAMATVVKAPAQAAEVTEGSRKSVACWVIDEDGDVLVLTDDMRGAYIAGGLFKREAGI